MDNTATYCYNSKVTKKMKCCEYGPWAVFTKTYYHCNFQNELVFLPAKPLQLSSLKKKVNQNRIYCSIGKPFWRQVQVNYPQRSLPKQDLPHQARLLSISDDKQLSPLQPIKFETMCCSIGKSFWSLGQDTILIVLYLSRLWPHYTSILYKVFAMANNSSPLK